MFRKSPVVLYLDNLLIDMSEAQRSMVPTLPADEDEYEGHIASTLATLASLRVIAEVVATGESSAAVRRRLQRADKILRRGLDEFVGLSTVFDLSWDRIVAMGRDESYRYLESIGGDAIYQHEYGRQHDYARIRIDAVRATFPESEGIATSALFWSIIGSAFGDSPVSDLPTVEADQPAGRPESGMPHFAFRDFRVEAMTALAPAEAMG